MIWKNVRPYFKEKKSETYIYNMLIFLVIAKG